MVALFTLLAALTAQATQAPATTGAVSGRVTLEGTNTPAAGVRIVLFPTGRRDVISKEGRLSEPLLGRPGHGALLISRVDTYTRTRRSR